MQRLKKLGIFFLILLALAAVGLLVLYGVGQSKLASRGGGAIPTADELVYPDLTDDENAAILYRAAWNTLKDTPEGTSDDAQMLVSEYTKTILARQQGETSEEALSDEDIQFVGVLLADADPAFEILRQVRDTKGALFLNDHSPASTLQNQKDMEKVGTWMRGLARYVAARALWESEQGNTDASLDWVATGLRLSNDLTNETVLIGEMVRAAIALQMLSAAQGTLYDHPLSEPVPHALLDELNDVRDRKHHGNSLRREAVFSEALMQAQGMFTLGGIWKANYLESFGAFIKAVEEDDYTERTRMLAEWSDDVARSSKGVTKFLHVLDSIMMPGLARSDDALERLIAESDLLELALALRAYEQTHGVFPETLADLAPEFLLALPQDPLNGKQYPYEKTAEHITVRSEEKDRRGDEIAFHLKPIANGVGASDEQ